MDFEFSIHFGKTPSSGYERAVEYASVFDKFTPIGAETDLNIVETSNHEVLQKYSLFLKLKNSIAGWKSAGVRYRDRESDPVSFFLKVNEVVECYNKYLKAENQAEYCDVKSSNCWGCRQLSGIILHHDEAAFNERSKYWYQYGAFTNDNTWKINKEELFQALTEIAEEKCIDFCPIFQYQFCRRVVATLPSTIDVSDTKNWGKVFIDETLTDSKKWEAVNIYHKTAAVAKESEKPGRNILLSSSAQNQARQGDAATNEKLRYIPEISFADVGGIDEIVSNIRTVIELPIIKPELFDHLGIKPYRGILLWGEPGNGKTLIAKAIAHEVKAHFIPVGGPDILNKSFGESEKNMRDIFEEARELQPSVIFIDELDSIAQTRMEGETAKWYASIVNQLMSLMDGIKEYGNVSVIASTNRPDLLDAALLRPGRFDYKLEIRRPNVNGCKKVLEIATRKMPLAEDVDLFSFAEAVVGFSAAEVTFIAKEAAMTAIRRNIDIKAVIRDEKCITDFTHIQVRMSDFMSALIVMKRNSQHTKKIYTLKG